MQFASYISRRVEQYERLGTGRKVQNEGLLSDGGDYERSDRARKVQSEGLVSDEGEYERLGTARKVQNEGLVPDGGEYERLGRARKVQNEGLVSDGGEYERSDRARKVQSEGLVSDGGEYESSDRARKVQNEGLVSDGGEYERSDRARKVQSGGEYERSDRARKVQSEGLVSDGGEYERLGTGLVSDGGEYERLDRARKVQSEGLVSDGGEGGEGGGGGGGEEEEEEGERGRLLCKTPDHEQLIVEPSPKLNSKVKTLASPWRWAGEPPQPLDGTMSLIIRRMDNTSFVVEVQRKALVSDLRDAIEKKFQASDCQVSWPHVWGYFCLSFRDQKLLEEDMVLHKLGIGDLDELVFVKHLDTRPIKDCQQRSFFKKALMRKHKA